ncbi:hypothetical protein Syun_001637 [Stephania yunnanensis]|uniref:Histone-lysine N-methyltransferase SUVR3 n=1 Tax=Stephania yunnanensis TaxID=152371 RepID=A0AAP0LE29_9MAGN
MSVAISSKVRTKEPWVWKTVCSMNYSESKRRNCCITAAKEDYQQHPHPHPLFDCAQLILSRLSPPDLATASSTSKTLHRIAQSIATQRSSDASRGLESHPIPFANTVDSHPYSYFLYTPSLISPFPFPPLSSLGSGCVCDHCFELRDGEIECPCFILRSELVSGHEQGLDLMNVMVECGMNCNCGLDCKNRLTQSGISVRLRIVKHKRKGWGLFADQFVQRGQFVCEYAGELISTEEARRRQSKYDELAASCGFASALLVVREHLPSRKACLRINIDATRIGNAARFINHSCDGGNLSTVLVRSSGVLHPRLCFFASKDILEGEELAFSYGDARLRPNGLQCFCGSLNCNGVLPSEET